MNVYILRGAWGGGYQIKNTPFDSESPLKLKSSGNWSISIDLTSKKDFMKKYLFFFENELIKVENSWLFSDFAQILLVFSCELQWKPIGKPMRFEQNHYFDELVLEEK